jgi:hypothetical protein
MGIGYNFSTPTHCSRLFDSRPALTPADSCSSLIGHIALFSCLNSLVR